MNSTAGVSQDRKAGRGFSVGLKMMIGAGLFSNLCIGLLLYVNITAFFQIASKTNALLEMNASMNKNLRSGIFDLQKKYLEIPKLLETDSAQPIIDWIRTDFSVEKEDTLKGPDQYRGVFDRTGRRDLAGGGFVMDRAAGSVIVSKGLMNSDGSFSDSILRLTIKSETPEQDLERIKTRIEETAAVSASPEILKQKVLDLNNLLADEAMAAETVRNEILYKVEDIQKEEASLLSYREKKRDAIVIIAVLAIVINLVMLHLMTFFVVERPLKRLTLAIKKINKGETVLIPFQAKKDQIGILAGALENFQEALTDLKAEDQRKKNERSLIQDLVQKSSGLIDGLQKKATAMKDTAGELSLLASDTENQTHEATRSAARTVEQTRTVSGSTRQLQSAVENISDQVLKQTRLISDINAVAAASRQDILELTRASEQINEIVHIVKNLAGETKLLALNARIEAARSGAAGKGFTVVAGEVRELSLQTEAANEDIAVKIESIQKVSRTIIENTRMIETRLEKLMEASRNISTAVEEQALSTGGIAKNAEATSLDIKVVSERIVRVTDAAKSTHRFAKNVQFCSEEIAAELTTLLTETQEKLSMITRNKS
ncbi:MAG: methyl-accepting chemotaxis protein [Desulfobacula sp.]